MTSGSPPLTLNRADLLSILRGSLMAAGGAIVTYLSTQVIPNLDESTMLGAAIAGIGSIVLNALRKYLANT